ncbi:histidine kinase [Halovivax asiaticus JCM 14624]|uniref:histidine kinase n=1 Tax=Halovivax asiaticus JCM 14624 TaxID=1227490 RepID=M0BTX3_9EURY|nr:histidine kinase [Halovivax asiaticus JCM 14624]
MSRPSLVRIVSTVSVAIADLLPDHVVGRVTVTRYTPGSGFDPATLAAIDSRYLLYVTAFSLAALACLVSLSRLSAIADTDTRRGLGALLVTSGGWAGSQVGYLVAPTRALTLASYVSGLVLGFTAVGAWLYFCSAYTGRGYHRNPTYRRLGLAVLLPVIALKVTNPLHQGYFSTVEATTPFPHLAIQTGPLHWTAMGLAYALTFVGFFMLFELFTAVDHDTRPLFVLVGLTGLPVVGDIVGATTPHLVDMTYEPLGVAVFAVGVAFVSLEQFEAVRVAGERETPLISLDSDGRIRDTNRAARTVFPALDGSHGEPLDAILPTVTERIHGDDPIIPIERSGDTQYLRVTESPLASGTADLGRTIVLTDVTERKAYRRELERQNDRLDRFASVVSHDLRNPLNVATGRLEIARETDPDDENLAEIEAALDRMGTLIDDVLVLAREGQTVESREPLTLSTVTADSWEMVDGPDAECTIETDLNFAGDSDRLTRLFENLFRNALDHAGDDVAITAGAFPDRSGFFVEDDGPGIDPAKRDDVFEQGYTSDPDGTGFGLAIVAEIVAAHGWSIGVTESQEGGARFEITGVTEQTSGKPPERAAT